MVDEYVTEWPKLSDGKREIRVAHPLVVFAEAFLEQFSTNVLATPVIGLTETSRKTLVSVRRRLEEKGQSPSLQILIFALEELCALIPGAKYGGGDSADEDHFHHDYFPRLLRAIATWADPQLHSAVAASLARYTEVVGES